MERCDVVERCDGLKLVQNGVNDRTVLQEPTWASTIYCEVYSEPGLSGPTWKQTGNYYASVSLTLNI